MDQVKHYLTGRDIEFGYANLEGCIMFLIKDVDTRLLIFRTDLQVRIYVSEGAGVSEIQSELFNTAL